MGERPIIPLSDAFKAKVDVATIGTATAGYLQAIPWPEIAAALAAFYTLLRIIELVVSWVRRK